MWTKPWRVGLWTVAIGWIALGAIIMVHSISGFLSYRVLEYVWPVLLIALGAEIVWHRYRHPAERLRFSGGSMILIALMFLASLGDFGVSKAMSALTAINGVPFIFFGNSSPVFLAPVQGDVRVNSSIREIDLKIPNGSVTITPTTGQTLTYKGQLGVYAQTQSGANEVVKRDWSVVQSGDTLDLTLSQSNVSGIGWKHLDAAPHLRLVVPADLITHIHTALGSIKVSNMNASTVEDTVLGSASAQHIRGSVSENTVNGGCFASNVSGNFSAHTINGDITFHQVGGNISTGSINGEITGASGVSGPWDLHTVNGSITVSVRGTVNATIKADTANGGVHGNVPWQSVGSLHHHGESTLGAGTNPITLRAVSGDITVNHTAS